jgi:hypothetical protein
MVVCLVFVLAGTARRARSLSTVLPLGGCYEAGYKIRPYEGEAS